MQFIGQNLCVWMLYLEQGNKPTRFSADKLVVCLKKTADNTK